MLKLPSILEKIYPGDANTFVSIIIDKYENRLDELHSLCLADEHQIYISKKEVDVHVSIEHDKIKSYSVPVVNINILSLISMF